MPTMAFCVHLVSQRRRICLVCPLNFKSRNCILGNLNSNLIGFVFVSNKSVKVLHLFLRCTVVSLAVDAGNGTQAAEGSKSWAGQSFPTS
jgi:hypothetical protein